MGPNLIFDKSLLQSLNQNEAVWLDMFFYTNVTPLFYIETLADLEKEVDKGRTPEEVVGNLAYKTPDMYVAANVHHRNLLEGELSGLASIDMRFGRPIVGGGRDTLADGKRGVVFEQSPEQAALSRWQGGQFLDIERNFARAWREALSFATPRDDKLMFPRWYGNRRPRDLLAIKTDADSFIDGKNKKSSLDFGLSLLCVDKKIASDVVSRWEAKNCPDIADFLPYFRHVYGVELFYYLARSADLISERPTNKIDIAYLYYLPFCVVFTSNDKLHRDTIPLFMRPHQSFIWGQDLKKDLGQLDQHYGALPEEVRNKGLHYFASLSPSDTSFLITQLWDKHMRPDWRTLSSQHTDHKGGTFESKMLERVKRDAEAPSVDPSSGISHSDKLDHMVTKHFVHRRKGKWNRFPPDVK